MNTPILKTQNRRALLFLCLLSTCLLNCNQGPCQIDPDCHYTYQVPEQLNDGLETGSLDELGLDLNQITRGIERVYKGKYNELHAALIYKDSKLVLEEYFEGHQYQWDGPGHHADYITWDQSIPHHIMSCTKSITGLCVGLAMEKGFIDNVNQSIFDYLPDHQPLKTDGKDRITIEHLLTMTSGLEFREWDAPYSSSENDIIALWFPPCEDPVTCILQKPLLHEPGSTFNYGGGNQIVLGEIIRHASGMGIDEFARQYLFEPLGITEADWGSRFENGVIEAAGGLVLRPRDMLKIGVMVLNEGVWKGERIISKQWIDKSATTYGDNTGIRVPGTESSRKGYSYSWWTYRLGHDRETIEVFRASGWGGQRIIVMPELEAVVVFTGGNYTTKVKSHNLLEKYLLPAM
jgi:CubicO group peptidase (beta-lactamase class C family)